jgi:hypothetical protein
MELKFIYIFNGSETWSDRIREKYVKNARKLRVVSTCSCAGRSGRKEECL